MEINNGPSYMERNARLKLLVFGYENVIARKGTDPTILLSTMFGKDNAGIIDSLVHDIRFRTLPEEALRYYVKDAVRETDMPVGQFISACTAIKTAGRKYSAMTSFLKHLRSLGLCRTAVMADVSAFEKNVGYSLDTGLYDHIFLSYETGYIRPQIQAYRHVESMTEANGENILLIDSSQDSLDSAKELGWHTCLVKNGDPSQIASECIEFLERWPAISPVQRQPDTISPDKRKNDEARKIG